MSKMKIFAHTLCAIMLLNMASCGYILYPERKGQTGGKIDVGVAVLDGVGLLFFIIPGIIAYAVDFTYGTIYLPGTVSSDSENGGVNVVTVDGDIDIEVIEGVLQKQVNLTVDLDSTYVLTQKVESIDDIAAQIRWVK